MKHLAPLVALVLSISALSAAEGRRPNFLFILVDDQAPSDFAFYDSASPLDAPNIGRLAAEGMVIDRAYHMGGFVGAVCTPSRHMIMSGRTLWHLPLGPLAKTHCPPQLEKETLPAVFARAGYDTMRTCKRGNIYLLDTLATLCELAGIEAPATNEGISFKPVLTGEKATIRETLYGVYNGGTKPGMRSVRKGDWKLIQYDVMDGEVRKTQLFNLAENPDELLAEHHGPAVVALTGTEPKSHQRNLADDPDHAGKLAEMKALLLEEMRRHDDPWRLWDQPDDGLVPPKEEAARGRGKK